LHEYFTYHICSLFEKASILHKLSVHAMSTVHIVFLLLLLKNLNSYVRSIVLQKDILEDVYGNRCYHVFNFRM